MPSHVMPCLHASPLGEQSRHGQIIHAASRLPVLRGGYHHSPSQHRLLRVRALLPPAGLLEGGGRSRHPSSILPYFLVSSLV